MNKNKNIQMPESFVLGVYKLLQSLNSYELDNYTAGLKNTLETQINSKIDAMTKRELYTQSKIAASPSEREAARQRYLNAAEIPEEYRHSYKTTTGSSNEE